MFHSNGQIKMAQNNIQNILNTSIITLSDFESFIFLIIKEKLRDQ